MSIIPTKKIVNSEFVTLMNDKTIAAIARFDGKYLKCDKVFV